MIVKLKPHSLDPSALDALDNTLKTLPRGGSLVRTENGVCVTDGWIECDCEDSMFVVWAAKQQGYVVDAKVDTKEVTGCIHESMTAPDGHGAYCAHCGETLS